MGREGEFRLKPTAGLRGLASIVAGADMMVKDWKRAWRWHSTQAFTFIALAPIVWMELPPEAQAYMSGLVPAEYHPLIITVVALVGIIGRLRDQGIGQ